MKHKIKKGHYQIPINDSTYKHFLKLRIMGIVVFSVYVLIILFTGLFVYRNVYSTIGFIDISAVAGFDEASEAIDFRLLDRVEEAWDMKHSPSTSVFSRDPFSAEPLVPATSIIEPPDTSIDSLVPIQNLEQSI